MHCRFHRVDLAGQWMGPIVTLRDSRGTVLNADNNLNAYSRIGTVCVSNDVPQHGRTPTAYSAPVEMVGPASYENDPRLGECRFLREVLTSRRKAPQIVRTHAPTKLGRRIVCATILHISQELLGENVAIPEKDLFLLFVTFDHLSDPLIALALLIDNDYGQADERDQHQ